MYFFCAAGIPLSVTDLAELYKVDDPPEFCQEGDLKPDDNCGDQVHFSHPSV